MILFKAFMHNPVKQCLTTGYIYPPLSETPRPTIQATLYRAEREATHN